MKKTFIKISVTNIEYEDPNCGAPKSLVLNVDREWYNQSPKACIIDAIIDNTGYDVDYFKCPRLDW